MSEDFLSKLFEHNNWANQQLIQACAALTDAQLDAAPQSVTKGTIRRTLFHLVDAQRYYLALLTRPVDARSDPPLAFAELAESARVSGEALLALVKDPSDPRLKGPLQTADGYFTAPWVVMVQIINHANEHREQISSMLTALGVTPPVLDGWSFGKASQAMLPIFT